MSPTENLLVHAKLFQGGFEAFDDLFVGEFLEAFGFLASSMVGATGPVVRRLANGDRAILRTRGPRVPTEITRHKVLKDALLQGIGLQREVLVGAEVIAAPAGKHGALELGGDRVVEDQFGDLIGELEEEQVGDLLDVVAVTDLRVLEDMGVVSRPLGPSQKCLTSRGKLLVEAFSCCARWAL